MSIATCAALEQLFRPETRQQILHAVHRRFSGRCLSEIEDAIQTAGEKLLSQPATVDAALARGGVHELRRVFVVIVWRSVFHAVRRSNQRQEVLWDDCTELRGAPTPEELAIAAQILRTVPAWTQEAATCFGGRHSGALARALDDLMGSAETETSVAERNGVRREYLNRAKNWLAARMTATPAAGGRSPLAARAAVRPRGDARGRPGAQLGSDAKV